MPQRKIIVNIATSADGYVARPDGNLDWLTERPAPQGFYGLPEFERSIDAKILGRKTFDRSLQLGARFSADRMHYVFSRRAPASAPAGVHFVTEAIGAFAEHLRKQPGKKVWMMGRGEIIGSFLDKDAIDEFIITVMPIFIGEGIPLFPSRHRDVALRLVGGGVQPQNPQNLRAEWAPGYNDVRQRLVANYVYELPFGSGKRWMAHPNRALNAVAGGWQVNGIWTAQGGLPFTINSPSDTSNSGSPNIRPNATGQPTMPPPDQRNIHQWISPAAFVLPTGYSFGNVGRNTGVGPGLSTWDFSAFKNFRFTERPTMLQFRAELFNSLNHPNFGLPGRTFNTATFGVISTTTSSSRDVPFALKLIF